MNPPPDLIVLQPYLPIAGRRENYIGMLVKVPHLNNLPWTLSCDLMHDIVCYKIMKKFKAIY